MTLFLLRRVLRSIVVLLLVTVITFALLRAIPGEPSSDHPTLLEITVVVAAATVVGSLFADILYAVLDPRVRYVDH